MSDEHQSVYERRGIIAIDRRASTRANVERRKRGRPPLVEGDPSADVRIKVEGSLYDRIYVRASEQRMTVNEIIRKVLRSHF